MPTYMYRAVTKSGLVVRNRVEAASKQSLIKSLKSSQMIPIDIEQLRYADKKKKAKKKNITDIQFIFCKNRKNNSKRFGSIYTRLLFVKKSKL